MSHKHTYTLTKLIATVTFPHIHTHHTLSHSCLSLSCTRTGTKSGYWGPMHAKTDSLVSHCKDLISKAKQNKIKWRKKTENTTKSNAVGKKRKKDTRKGDIKTAEW